MMRAFKGKCWTCGHDHDDNEVQRLRDQVVAIGGIAINSVPRDSALLQEVDYGIAHDWPSETLNRLSEMRKAMRQREAPNDRLNRSKVRFKEGPGVVEKQEER